ncbi:MAG: sulfatase-like hydrolase/transferase [Acidobacteriota bacterium]
MAGKRRPGSGTKAGTAQSTATPSPHRSRAAALLIAVIAVAAVVGGFVYRTGVSGTSPPPDIILITIDTLRADALGYSGNARVKTPFLDSLAARGIVYTNAHAHNVVTLASHTNILTGLYPYQHGIRDNAGFVLDPKFPTLGAMLKAAGYATAAFVSAFPLDGRFGLNRGFDVYDDRYREASDPLEFVVQERPAEETLAAARRWYDAAPPGKKFLWIHLYDPHAPYDPPAPFRELYKDAPYLGEVAYTDDQLGKFLGPVLERHLNTFVVITADHGEALGDHGEQTHGLFAYESTLKVPLIVINPGAGAKRDDRYVRHVDIVPTILERVGAIIPANLPGKSLLSGNVSRDTYFEALSASLNRSWAPLVGLIHGSQKYIDLPLPELYDLSADPSESHNIVESDRRDVFTIRKLLADSAPRNQPITRNVDEAQKAQLLSLGYITGSSTKKSYTVADDPKKLIDVDNMLHDVVALYQTGQLDKAIEKARAVLTRSPDIKVADEMLAFMLQQKEKPDEAIATLRRSVQSGAATDAMRVRLGLLLSENGKAQEAVQILAPFAGKADPDVLNAYGIALADSGHLVEAKQQFDRVLQVDPTNARAYQNLGVAALRAGDLTGAIGYLQKALALNDRLPLALNTLGVIYAKEGDSGRAIDAWQKAVRYDSHQYDAMYNLAIVANRSGRNDVARDALKRFIDTAPPQRYADDIATARALLGQIDK